MDIAAASTQMSMAETKLSASYGIANKVMDTTKAQAAQLLEMLPQPTSFGHRIDFRV